MHASAGRLGWRYPGRVPVTCDFCGATADGDDTPLTWSTAVENGRLRRFCDRCSREHLRAMEGKLDSDLW